VVSDGFGASIHNGYHYESVKMKKEFFGPEKIKMPNGDEIVITPNK